MKLKFKNNGVDNLKQEIVVSAYLSPSSENQNVGKIDFTTATYSHVVLGSYKARTSTAFKYKESIYYGDDGNNKYLESFNVKTLIKTSKTYYDVHISCSIYNDAVANVFGGGPLNSQYNFVNDNWVSKTDYLNYDAVGGYSYGDVGAVGCVCSSKGEYDIDHDLKRNAY